MQTEELNQYISLKAEISIYNEQIEHSTNKDDIGQLIKKRDENIIRVKNIENFIDSIPNVKTRIVFRRKYQFGDKWLAIAFRINARDKSTPKRLHDKYMKKWGAS